MVCFTHEKDAKQFSIALIEWLAEFALEVEPSKTALLRFSSYAKRHLQEHIAYFGVSGNSRSLRTYAYQVSRVLLKEHTRGRFADWEYCR